MKHNRGQIEFLPFLIYNIVEEHDMPRYIAITDIHGELRKLESVLSQIETRPDDIFVFMGDYIDRGPDSKGVVERVIAQSETHKCIYLMGSHEYALLHAKTDDYYQFLFDNYGGPATVRSYGSFEIFSKSTVISLET